MSADVDVVVVDSGGANLASLGFALDRLGARSVVSADAERIARAPRVLLPGVGAAGSIMQRLESLALVNTLRNLQCPVLGICLGMQILCERSEEDETPCLGILPGTVKRFAEAPDAPVPHMGWNRVRITHDDPLLRGLSSSDWFYFVHSYHLPPKLAATLAETDYSVPFTSIVRQRNFCGVQFHPERSSTAGARVLRNFLELT
ncbi:MAG: imidazole glycerol phosphate synthase subunit HisH [Sinobacteraceae bacterium]|nr:imidazole glycerol phosphate synthase subunit HisH [Nevskiaceae bacterium]